MKIFAFLISLIYSQFSFAYPAVGDTVQFQKSDGSIFEMKNLGLDSTNQVWLVQVTDDSKKITVPGGIFETCKFANDVGGYTWIGDVPFSMVKVVTSNLTLELLQ